ncbi:DUF4817 domain-containing protein [Trichonephila clavipes]|nr:DUF4817 domain-containing protein [Trichonephila clavipes]
MGTSAHAPQHIMVKIANARRGRKSHERALRNKHDLSKRDCLHSSRGCVGHSCLATHSLPLCIDDCCETGSFNVHKLDTGHQRTTRTVDAEDRVLRELERSPSTSTRVVSRETHILQATVWRIAHDEGLHPYHLQRVQALELGDYNKHMDFARWFLHESNADRNFAASVLFTDEATFSLEGVMNFHNLHTWADENPHAIRPHGAQRKCSINVWAGIVGDCLLDLYILPERLIGSVYLTFLQEALPEMLNDVPMPIPQRIRFQHDGAPAHFSIDVRAQLQTTFPGGWIGCGGPIVWPARSPDQFPLDFSYGDF